METADTDLIQEFVVESQEGLAHVENQMLAIEAAGANIDTNLVNAVFRTMHSIKGTAGFLGLDRIGVLAHNLEEILNNLRNCEVIPTSELVSTVLHATDFMKGLIDEVDSSNDADVSLLVTQLQKFRPSATEANHEETNVEGKANTGSEVKSPSPLPLMGEAMREFLEECYENLDQMDRDLVTLEAEPTSETLLRSIFRTMHTVKGGAGFLALGAIEKLAHAAENLLCQLRSGERMLTPEITNALLATVDNCREGLELVETSGSDAGFDSHTVTHELMQLAAGASPSASESATSHRADVSETPAMLGQILIQQGKVQPRELEAALQQQQKGDPLRLGEILVEQRIIHAQDVREAVSALQDNKAPIVSDSTIRVDVALLDKLMTRVGELVLARNQILQYTSKLEDASFVSTAQRLNLITTELQESVMKTRMQPIGNVWSKFPRVVRDLASQLSKQVRIEMEGKETELDKTIVEAIKDPLTHIVRNSVDHGIEKPELRRATGKPEEGCLLLRAFHEGGQVNIEITDDGAGINVDRIRRKAIERGLVSADQAARMSEREAIQLIMLPGFSTAEQVTSVSGRGVGMDVVKTNIERIGGTLDIQSQQGQGTTVKIKIPLTLAIIPALVVTSDGERYAIPQVSLLELVRLEGEEVTREIEFVQGAPVYRLRGKLLPLLYLSEQLGRGRKTNSETMAADAAEQVVNIVVLRANDRQFGLVVDKINDTEEIVVKPLSRQLKGLGEYAGATIMGDGDVALILDVMGLALASGVAGEGREQAHAAANDSDAKSGDAAQSLLVVDLGDARRFALPTSMVSRLEKAPRTSIEYADGREVLQYRGNILPLLRLEKLLEGTSNQSSDPEELQIVVYAEQGRSYGLIVNRIVDVVETELRYHTQKPSDDLLIGTTVIQQRVTDVLNLPNLARQATSARRVSAN